MYICGVDLPAALVNAHAAGRLVIFVGAGASMSAPSSLPSFKELVREIRDGSNLSAVITDEELDEAPLDEILGRIQDDYGVDVHRRVFEVISREGSQPSALHEAIARLMSASTVRLITTNYDTHLSAAFQDVDVPEYLGPALPLGDDFTGIVYIHGRLDQQHRYLVATDEDFGKAYLNDAWAARFLDRMFGEYPVLFVGYSHNDTIMKYLARGLGGRSEKRYVLTSDPDDTFWRRLGITPIQCLRAQQPVLLNDWAARSVEGLLGARERVKIIVTEQEPPLIPESASFLEEILASKETVRFFTEYARGDAWLLWADNRPEFATLFHSSTAVDGEITRALSFWFAENFVTEEDAADTAYRIVVSAGGYLGDDLLFAVSRQLTHQQLPLSDRMRRWLLIVTNGRENRFKASLLSSLVNANIVEVDPGTALFLLDYLSEPRILPSGTYSQLFGPWFEPVMRDGEASLRDLWGLAFRPYIDRFSAQFIEIAERHIRRADLQLIVAGESDRDRPSTWRSRIVAEERDLTSLSGSWWMSHESA
ncbi:SIR2 family protein [Mycobacterium sp. ITM-2016-00316]|uniref:SIR2 family protein n=1 Tax=Mycobacterium sp. ITM-2016-00316 TaxID=2099695 RepID=UPI00287FC216|nr:SIR2 family protein [Mycobacterium sp. ITM-2016-00316]WNG82390.1 SIR2 family protein [Mycobacterium sp. ITM-2016-00316]